MEEKEVILTQEGFDKIEQELEYLRTEQRAEIAERIKVALGFGDLSENSEYDEAKNEQGMLEAQIADLEAEIANAIIVDEDSLNKDEIGIGSVVTLYDYDMEEEWEIKIVGSNESDPDNNMISDESPIGKACLKKHEGEVFEVEVPAGTLKFKVISMTY